MKKAATYLQNYILLCMIYYNGNCHQNARQDLKKRFGADTVIAIQKTYSLPSEILPLGSNYLK